MITHPNRIVRSGCSSWSVLALDLVPLLGNLMQVREYGEGLGAAQEQNKSRVLLHDRQLVLLAEA